jgi:hypothetical protein
MAVAHVANAYGSQRAISVKTLDGYAALLAGSATATASLVGATRDP